MKFNKNKFQAGTSICNSFVPAFLYCMFITHTALFTNTTVACMCLSKTPAFSKVRIFPNPHHYHKLFGMVSPCQNIFYKINIQHSGFMTAVLF